MNNILRELIDERGFLLADGATGTNLFALGLQNGMCGELWCIEQPENVKRIYQDAVNAGSDLILTNSFSSNKFRLKLHGLEEQVETLNIAASQLAIEVAESSSKKIIVAGSIGPTGEMIEPLGETTVGEAQEAFLQQAQALKAGEVDVLWIETMFSVDELNAAIAAAIECGLPYVTTMTFDTHGKTMMGVEPEQAVQLVRNKQTPPAAYGANCGLGPAQLIDTIRRMGEIKQASEVIVAKGNCGLPKMGSDMKIHYDATPEIMGKYAVFSRNAGAEIIGGCCGTESIHIAAMRKSLDSSSLGPAPTVAEIENEFGPVAIRTDNAAKRPRRRSRTG